MIREGSKITVHFINHWNHSVPTEVKVGSSGKIFTVKRNNGKLGFDGNTTRSPYTSRGELFTPFSEYAWTVMFKNVNTGHIYRYSDIKKELEDVTGLKDGYIDNIAWLKEE